MKRTTKQITLAGLFACAFATASFGVASLNSASATVLTSENITMYETASLRLEQTLEDQTTLGFGLRFKTQVNAKWYNGLTNPQVYTLLLPTGMLDGELTADAVTTLGAVQADLDENKKYSVDGEVTYLFNTVLTSIPETAYGTEISVRSYIVADGMEATYSPVIEGTYASSARSVVKVANDALESDADKWDSVKKYVITGVDAPDDRYVATDATSNVNATLLFADGTSETVQNTLAEKYPLSYASDAEEIVTVAEDGTLTAVSAGTANITVSNETLGLSKTVKVTAYEATPATYGVMSFENLDMVEDVKAYNYAQNLELVEDGISFYHDGETKQWVGFSLDRPQWLANFDTMTVTVELTDGVEVEDAENWLFYGISSVGTYYTLSEGSGANLNLTNNKKTYVFDLETLLANKNMANVVENAFTFYVSRRQDPKGQSATFTISEPKFEINDISAKTGETVNLYEKFHTDEASASFNFVATDGTRTAIDNPEAYEGSQDGVIEATIGMDGYADGTVTANYDYTKLSVFGQVLDFTDSEAASSVSAYSDATSDVSIVENGTDKYAIAFTATNSAKNSTYGVNITKPDWVDVAKNAYLKVTFELYSNTGKATYYPYSTTFLGAEYKNLYIGGAVIAEDDTVATVTTQVSLADIVKNDVIRIFITSNNATASTSKFKITEISIGYKDILISANHENSLNLATHFGVEESEISNVTFNGTEVSDVTAFAPTEDGTLSFTLNRNGYMSEECSVQVVEATETLTYSGTVIDLENATGVYMYYSHSTATYQGESASVATDIESTGTAKRNFAPTESGVLTVTVGRLHPKYATTTFKIDVTVEATA